MPDATEVLILDLLEWIGTEDRSYAETMEKWRMSWATPPGAGGGERHGLGDARTRERAPCGEGVPCRTQPPRPCSPRCPQHPPA